MHWKLSENNERGYRSWVPIAREIPGDPTSVTFFRQPHHIEVGGFRFMSKYAWSQLGAKTPWDDMSFEVLDDEEFEALRHLGLTGLFTWRVANSGSKK